MIIESILKLNNFGDFMWDIFWEFERIYWYFNAVAFDGIVSDGIVEPSHWRSIWKVGFEIIILELHNFGLILNIFHLIIKYNQ